MEELIKLLCDYSANSKIIDKNYLLAFFNDLKNGIGLNGCVLTFANFFDSLFSADAAAYDLFYDTVISYYNKLRLPSMGYFNKNWQKFEIYLFRNLFVLDSLIHELIHAKEYRKCAEGGDDLETNLLLASCSYKPTEEYVAWLNTMCDKQYENKCRSKKEINAKRREILYRISAIQKPYIVNPFERIAEIGANLSLVGIINQIDAYIPNLVSLFQFFLLFAYSDGYNFEEPDNLGPSFEYLSKTDNLGLWQSFDFYSPNKKTLIRKAVSLYSLEDRLYLGLPVIKSETGDIERLVYSKFKGVSI